MIRVLTSWYGVAATFAAVLFLLASENRVGAGLNGAVAASEDTLIAARGLMPNYLSGNGRLVCCYTSVGGLKGWVCDCNDVLDDTNCGWCTGISALSGYYSAGAPSTVQPSGATLGCTTMDLWVGLCDDGDCDGAFSGSTCFGSYPGFDFQSTMNGGSGADVRSRLAVANISRQ
jgi:hypothetical protein